MTSEEGIISYSLVKKESFTGDFINSFSLDAGTSDDMNYDIINISIQVI